MKFSEVKSALSNGKSIRRTSWLPLMFIKNDHDKTMIYMQSPHTNEVITCGDLVPNDSYDNADDFIIIDN